MKAERDEDVRPRPRVGLALAGGGAEGAVWEIGALRALDEALEGVDFNAMHAYVGVSAGSFLAACLANGITPAQLCRAVVRPGEHPFAPEVFFKPAFGELLRRGSMAPSLMIEAFLDYIRNPEDLTLLESLTRMARALPVGIFDSGPIREYLEHVFGAKGRTDDFRKLGKRLFVVAADLDSGRAVLFGSPGFDDVPISRAVQASTALPGLYPPVVIGGRHYVDGVLLKTLHASVAIEADCDLVLCVNPIVPVDTADAVEAGVMKESKLVNRGLPTVLSQTFRTLIHSRLTVGLAAYGPRYPGTDVILLEPQRDDFQMFFTNIFRFTSRVQVCEHAYGTMRRQLLERREELEPLLARRGMRLRVDVLEDAGRELWKGVGLEHLPGAAAPVTERLDLALARLESILE